MDTKRNKSQAVLATRLGEGRNRSGERQAVAGRDSESRR